MKSKQHKRRILIGAAGVVVVALVLGWFSASQSNGRLLQRALRELAATDTLHATARLDLNLPERLGNSERPFKELTFTVDGDVVVSETGQPELAGTLAAEARGRGNTFFATGELLLLHDFTVFKLADLPVLLNPSGSLVGRWTSTRASVLSTDPAATASGAQEALKSIATDASYEATETVNGVKAKRFVSDVTDEEASALRALLKRDASRSLGLDVAARLLATNNIKELKFWIDPATAELAQLKVNFVKPLPNDTEVDFATLTLALTDYGKAVAIERPESELKIDPQVFARIFGTGDVSKIDVISQR